MEGAVKSTEKIQRQCTERRYECLVMFPLIKNDWIAGGTLHTSMCMRVKLAWFCKKRESRNFNLWFFNFTITEYKL